MLSSSVLVIGGGIAGITAALNLAQRGIAVDLVERELKLGGNALTVCCKAVQGECQHCGACLAADRLKALSSETAITIHTSAVVDSLSKPDGQFYYTLKSTSVSAPLSAQAVILATGFDHIDAHTKGPYGYGVLPMVITGEEMERALRNDGQPAYDSALPREVAFIQCVGSRDEHAGRGWCSQVCCRYGVRLARLLKARSPQTNVTIFKMDIQHCGRDAGAYQASLKEGITYIAGLPAVVRRSEVNPARAELFYDDILDGKTNKRIFDLVVLATGIEPRHDAAAVAEMLQVDRNRFGFFAAADDSTTLRVPGIFAAGCCQAPRSISESIAHASVAAQACFRYLQEQAS